MYKKIVLNQDQLNIIKEMALKGTTITDMSKVLGVNRAIIRKAIEENNFVYQNRSHVGRKVKWTKEMKSKLTMLYNSDKVSLEQIAKIFNLSERTVFVKAKELGLNKVPVERTTFLTEDEQKFILENKDSMNLTELASILNRKRETIHRFVLNNNMTYKTNKKDFPQVEGFVEDLANPMYSHSALGRMYNCTELNIAKWRKEIFGDFKTMVDTYRCMSVPEMILRDYLEELDLSYMYEHKIDKYKVDFYLGFKLIIEVQGDYWHSSEEARERDTIKKDYLENLGYTVMYLCEKDLKDETKKNEIIDLIKTNLKTSVLEWVAVL